MGTGAGALIHSGWRAALELGGLGASESAWRAEQGFNIDAVVGRSGRDQVFMVNLLKDGS